MAHSPPEGSEGPPEGSEGPLEASEGLLEGGLKDVLDGPIATKIKNLEGCVGLDF